MANFNVIVAAFCVAGLTLVFALAYNIGGTAEESRAMKMGAITRTRMETIRERLSLCLSNQKEMESGRSNKETLTTFLQNTNDLLSNENKMFKEQNQEGLKAHQECVKHLEDLREEHTGTKVSNATHMIEHLEDEKHRLDAAVLRANSTREVSRDKLRRMIAAYRMEIASLAGVLKRKQKQMFEASRSAQSTVPVASKAPAVVAEIPQAVPEATAAPVVCDAKHPFAIMMDAGSTGSRTHVFKFVVDDNGELKLADEVFEHLKPGLSAFPDDPEAAAKSLIPLMEAAVKSVPADQAKCVSVSLKATAGLRLLGEEKSKAILAAVRKLLATYPFALGSNAVEVMDGKDEGPYAWLTVNFLLGNLAPSKKTVAILDMGGGSTQIVFQPDSVTALEGAPGENLYKAALRGVSLHAYQHSYLGLGLKEAAKTLLKAGAAAGGDDFACLPVGHDASVDGVVVKNTNASDFDACAALVAQHVVRGDSECTRKPCAFNGVFQPSLSEAFSGDIYAFSYFYDRMEAFLPEDGIVTVGTYKEIGTKICSGTDEPYASKNKGTMCMDFAFLYTLLHNGYGLADDRTLHIKKKINGIETAWPLGAALVEMP